MSFSADDKWALLPNGYLMYCYCHDCKKEMKPNKLCACAMCLPNYPHNISIFAEIATLPDKLRCGQCAIRHEETHRR